MVTEEDRTTDRWFLGTFIGAWIFLSIVFAFQGHLEPLVGGGLVLGILSPMIVSIWRGE